MTVPSTITTAMLVARPLVRWAQPVRRPSGGSSVGAAAGSSSSTGGSSGQANTGSVGTAGGALTNNPNAHGTGGMAGFNTAGTHGVNPTGVASSVNLSGASAHHFAF